MENIIEYCKTGNTLPIRKVSPEIKETLLKITPYTIKKYTDENNIYRVRAIEIMDILKKLNKEKNQTFLIVTHNDDVAHACKKIIRLKDGKNA